MAGWISVKDRLPEDGEYVLTYNEDDIGYEIGMRYYIKGAFIAGCVNRDVTHWMPLPEPPKGE